MDTMQNSSDHGTVHVHPFLLDVTHQRNPSNIQTDSVQDQQQHTLCNSIAAPETKISQNEDVPLENKQDHFEDNDFNSTIESPSSFWDSSDSMRYPTICKNFCMPFNVCPCPRNLNRQCCNPNNPTCAEWKNQQGNGVGERCIRNPNVCPLKNHQEYCSQTVQPTKSYPYQGGDHYSYKGSVQNQKVYEPVCEAYKRKIENTHGEPCCQNYEIGTNRPCQYSKCYTNENCQNIQRGCPDSMNQNFCNQNDENRKCKNITTQTFKNPNQHCRDYPKKCLNENPPYHCYQKDDSPVEAQTYCNRNIPTSNIHPEIKSVEQCQKLNDRQIKHGYNKYVEEKPLFQCQKLNDRRIHCGQNEEIPFEQVQKCNERIFRHAYNEEKPVEQCQRLNERFISNEYNEEKPVEQCQKLYDHPIHGSSTRRCNAKWKNNVPAIEDNFENRIDEHAHTQITCKNQRTHHTEFSSRKNSPSKPMCINTYKEPIVEQSAASVLCKSFAQSSHSEFSDPKIKDCLPSVSLPRIPMNRKTKTTNVSLPGLRGVQINATEKANKRKRKTKKKEFKKQKRE